LLLTALVALPVSALAQEADIAPVAAAQPATVAASAPVTDSDVAPFYAAHPGLLIWLRDTDTRAAATKLEAQLKDAQIDGLADAPALTASVDAALAGGTPADDQRISAAWVRYVQALRRPVGGISYGDPALQLVAPSASAILDRAAAAPSLAAHIDKVAAVNPFYAALRQAAIQQGNAADPHVLATLDRLRLVPADGRAILVDVANAELMVLEDGQVVDSMKVVVGKPDFPTPLLAGTIHYVTLNPYWHIPPDVAKRKVAPIVLKRGVAYLKAARYQTVAAFGGDQEQPVDPASIDWKAVAAGKADAHIRQLTGPNNMMGAMKFGFVNDYGIFLHDTPHKQFFAKAKRNLSLGCVRLEHPERLARWLMGHDPAPASDDAEQQVLLDHGVPVYISYLSARPDGDQIAFADDVYKLDAVPSGSKSGQATAAR
jgi:murein L,D-transpeptidase YcbB/YkuD